tara:strand:+ start:45465 stop:46145 length:681 start_codon:yes stop_codon:yes gene_type:complete
MIKLIPLFLVIASVHSYAEPATIIHILDTHYVAPVAFAADLRDQDSGITQEEIDKAYSQFLRSVESSQRGQMRALRRLIKEHKLKGVYVEGVTEKNHKGVLRFIQTLKKYEASKQDPPESAIDKMVAVQNSIDLMELGAAGRLVVSGELQTVLPVEDAAAFEAANPLKPDGKIVFNEKAGERRENAIVRNLQKGSGVVVITLGAGHDLRDNLKRLGVACKYQRAKY